MSKFRNWLYDEENATIALKIATTAMQCDRDPVENRKRIENRVNQIMQERPNIELIHFGEMITGWYDPLGMQEYHHNISETIPGKTTELLANLARMKGIFLSCGLSERRGDAFHNAQVLINPNGEIQAVHRKWNLKSGERQAGYKPGVKPVTRTEIKGIKTGIIICSDAAHPRTMKELMQSDLDLILYSLADDQDEKWFMAKAMARLYDAWIVSANRFGEENNYWNGHTVISDPLGKLCKTSVDQESYLVHTLKIAENRSRMRNWIRKIYVKIPLVAHVIKNWKILKSYYE